MHWRKLSVDPIHLQDSTSRCYTSALRAQGTHIPWRNLLPAALPSTSPHAHPVLAQDTHTLFRPPFAYLQAAEHCVLAPEGVAGGTRENAGKQCCLAWGKALLPAATLSSPVLVCRTHAQIAGLPLHKRGRRGAILFFLTVSECYGSSYACQHLELSVF